MSKQDLYADVKGVSVPVGVDVDEWLEKCLRYKRNNGNNVFSERDKMLIDLIYNQGIKCTEIAEWMSVSKQCISQQKNVILQKLRDADRHITAMEWVCNDSVFLLPLNTREKNCITKAGITTIGELNAMLCRGDAYKMCGIGRKTISNMREMVNRWKINHEMSV